MSRKRFDAIVAAANREDATPEAVQEFRNLIAADPDDWEESRDPLKREINRLISLCSRSPAIEEVRLLGVRQLRDKLVSETDGPLEHVLIDNLIMCWLRLGETEKQYSSQLKKGLPLPVADYWENRLTAAQKRLAKACETLARVRKLLRPAIHKTRLNIGVVNAVVAGSPIKGLLSD
jgi:hypothetical protein